MATFMQIELILDIMQNTAGASHQHFWLRLCMRSDTAITVMLVTLMLQDKITAVSMIHIVSTSTSCMRTVEQVPVADQGLMSLPIAAKLRYCPENRLGHCCWAT